jgi:hypothetical protein
MFFMENKRIVTGMPVRLNVGDNVYSGIYFGSLDKGKSVFRIYEGGEKVRYFEIPDRSLNLTRVSPFDSTYQGTILERDFNKLALPLNWKEKRSTPGLEVRE